MVHKNMGNAGCFILILVAVLAFSLLSFSWTLIFRTPLGLVLLGYLIYRYYKKNKRVEEPEHFEFKSEEEDVIDVDYEDYE
jgi:predicted membrane protein